jgi:hypothetical protein
MDESAHASRMRALVASVLIPVKEAREANLREGGRRLRPALPVSVPDSA